MHLLRIVEDIMKAMAYDDLKNIIININLFIYILLTFNSLYKLPQCNKY